MKKLMIAAVAVICAVAVQAATFNWQNTGSKTAGTVYDYTGAKIATGAIAVLIDSAVTDQASLLAAARSEAFDLTSYGISGATTTVNSSSKISATEAFTYGSAGTDYNFYFAILDSANNQLLISDIATGSAVDVGTPTVSFTGSATWSKNVIAGADTSYSTAGWYSTAVPEPTSGLLLLLGMAGLALRRKQA